MNRGRFARFEARTARALGAALLMLSCRRWDDTSPSSVEASASSAAKPSIAPPRAAPEPRRGMAFVPGGALVAGTPPNALPRIADEEIPGEQVILKGYYIDIYPFPNEEGALPLTNVSNSEAEALCAEAGKRLCTELEWERACKGPDNTAYEYGPIYDARRCGTGTPPRLVPSGLRAGCRTEFGVRDMHGGVWEWTSSRWGRGNSRGLLTLRGGNGNAGEIVGRCANGTARPADTRSPQVGFRCCAGPRNAPEVVLQVVRGKWLEYRPRVDPDIVSKVREVLPDEMRSDIVAPEQMALDHLWVWRPIGNEELVVLGGCAGIAVRPACGVVVARIAYGGTSALAWASSGVYIPNVQLDADPRDLWLFGGDQQGNFRRLVGYAHGRVSVGPKERRLPKPDKSRSKKKRASK